MSRPQLQLQDVFVRQGVPQHTFVAPVEYAGLKVALQTPGRCIVIEGPSGIGKTTAAVKAIADAGISDNVLSLSARKKADLDTIAALPSSLPIGVVLIDDFHRLDDVVKRDIADLMKTLADEGTPDNKLIVLGITNSGKSLISFGKDLANRIEIIRLEANPEEKIDQLISLGEQALNTTINIRDEIIDAAQGSFYLAQMLCYHALLRANILDTAETHTATNESFQSVKAQVLKQLHRAFHDTAVAFARGTKLRAEGRAPYLHLLHWISQNHN